MSKEKKFKKRVREHAGKHGMSYQAAHQQLSRPDEDEFKSLLLDKVYASSGRSERDLYWLWLRLYQQKVRTRKEIEKAVEEFEADLPPLALYKLAPPNNDQAVEDPIEAFHSWTEYADRLALKINELRAAAEPLAPDRVYVKKYALGDEQFEDRAKRLTEELNKAVIAYVDLDESVDRQIVKLLKEAGVPFTTIPVSGGPPVVAHGLTEFQGLDEVKVFIEGYKAGVESSGTSTSS